jgi:plastocyanin
LALAAFAAALGVAIFAGSGSAAPGRTWVVGVGADSADHGVQLLDFFPRTITVNVGDTVNFELRAVTEHTVTFLSGAKPPELAAPQKDGRVQFPSTVAFPQGGHEYDGSGYVNSGLLTGADKSWSVTFTKPGTYQYNCVLHPAQVGTVIVQPAGTPYLKTDKQYASMAAGSIANGLAAGAKLRAATAATAVKGTHGTIHTAPMVGDGDKRIALYRFGSDRITVKVGDTVRWVMKDPNEIHTVTFAGTGEIPAFIVAQPEAQGPPTLYYNPKVLAPAGGPVRTGNSFYNSSIMFPVNPPGPTEYSLKFMTPGTFTYWCVVHVPAGMRGTVVVTP